MRGLPESKREPGVADYEKVICQIKDVLGARLVTAPDGSISEIHIMAGSNRNPKQIVRDVESALLIQLGITVDHKKISVVQVQGQELTGEVAEDKALYRSTCMPLRLVSLNLYTRGLEAEATVELEAGLSGTIYQGYACGPNTPERHLWLVADATLNAVEKYSCGIWNLALEDLVLVEVAHRRAALCVIVLVSREGYEYLAGVALVKGDDRQAAAQAVLRALNCRSCVYGSAG
ncbi:hypothetical protein MOMUL_23540 [Moorella mulderi DSM 14980]|uniref:Uncharacterized protein n=1 Tax=Moorella mulderi DSM 14980 TaxID=1122241 RepID=A0A151AUX1_9FIRM|nr:hypothetical protein MOMUL_23540 [Moorella mulderi DSM 14980]